MSAEEFSRYDSMKLFLHQIYEFQKGVRSLVLCTMCRTCASLLSERLERLGIAYRIQSVTDSKVNLYFGNRMCLETVATFIHKPLNELSAEEDFMLGAMLGYDIAGHVVRRHAARRSGRRCRRGGFVHGADQEGICGGQLTAACSDETPGDFRLQ